ncbi:MAG TPA: phosphate ABC transporter ATP-binding protein [Anaerolineaceae bacterium]|jgi:phosphate transport system ATP-binding protein|nr:phosphate ABC transporter ATP-binding protein [Anaerolineaceae bacterium]HQN04400.1 phosphate ABC transporter ATP-binding protein [Anaerolineaceae bacterium]HQP08907.1 phosphate ABC transporter ATP-binding protein [Anaerolineaceae bacterium]
MDKICIENLTVRYSDGAESLKNINLSIPEKTITVIFGPAGGGKSTLLRTLNRLNDLGDVAELSGSVIMNGVNLLDRQTDVIGLRRKIGMVFSRPVTLPLTIFQNVSYGLEVAGERRKPVLQNAVESALKQAALWDEVYDRLQDPANALSGGQQQRLCIARTLALKPEVLMLDEPTSALDPLSTAKIEGLLMDLKNELTVILAPHNTQQAARLAEYAAFFLQGELVEEGDGTQMFMKPRKKKTQDYIMGRFG